jgi:dihydroorotase
MYKCKKCGARALVIKDNPILRGCDCFEEVLRNPITKFEKFCAFFGKKYYKLKRASIIVDINGSAAGTGQCKL